MAKQIMDGCTAATHVAYAFSEVATIYPITPVASMGQTAARWAMQGRKNLFGSTMLAKEMESELGAAGATHGALAAGALATTFTASQGLLLMIPNMFKISGELLPGVFHVGARSIATHALSIFGDHQDVMACRTTGFAMLASASVQETMDLAVVAHLAAIEGSLPVIHFFDGWRTSNEMNTIDVIPYSVMASLLDHAAVSRFRQAALNPDHPKLRGSAQNPDVYFQNREAPNKYYLAFPDIVQNAMDRLAKATGRSYHLFDYYGAPDADRIIVTLASSVEVIRHTVDCLNAAGQKIGLVAVRLFRPFSSETLLKAIPPTVSRIAVLDRTKEPGAPGEPLFLDVAAAVLASGRNIKVTGGRYGLASKDFTPQMARAVFDNLSRPRPLAGFTVGITDDVTRLSLPVDPAPLTHPSVSPDTITQAIFYGMGSDGTVGATRQAASILVDTAGLYAQAYFRYSAKKSGGFTISQLRFGPNPINAEYTIGQADFVVCNKSTYVNRFHLVDNLRTGGTLMLNSPWTSAGLLEKNLPASLRRSIAGRKARLININAQAIARANGLGVRINTIMEAAFLSRLSDIDYNSAIAALKQLISQTYSHEGGAVVSRNIAAVDAALKAVTVIDYPQSWADATDDAPAPTRNLPPFVANVAVPCNRLLGNSLPVSALTPDGSMPMGTTAYEKRRIAIEVPQWLPDKCIQCTQCSAVCSHAAIRPFLISPDEAAAAPAQFVSIPASAKALRPNRYRIQVYVDDCTGCASCATVCPGHALRMVPIQTQLPLQEQMLDYAQTLTPKPGLLPRFTLPGSQLHQPLLQFSGACGGCGETPYVKLLTQLFGERLLIANATGCSSIWSANFPSNAYCTLPDGRGPAWGNSLFEDNAEYAYGMAAAIHSRRSALIDSVKAIAANTSAPPALRSAATDWLNAAADPELSHTAGLALADQCRRNPSVPGADTVIARSDILSRKSVWAIGGDGWAYDIGFAGLDHVLAQNTDINILVLDTECYSNTGGQTSKATPLGAVMKYAPNGKRTYKKDLGRMMMTYRTVYVASIALGANYQQAITALREAEAYPGPSIVIAYCPCINHGIRAGMSHSITEEAFAVKAGYWPLYRYNPALAAKGTEPLTVDSAAPDGSLPAFLSGEDRYADLRMVDPAQADKLQPQLQTRLNRIYSIIKSQATDNSI